GTSSLSPRRARNRSGPRAALRVAGIPRVPARARVASATPRVAPGGPRARHDSRNTPFSWRPAAPGGAAAEVQFVRMHPDRHRREAELFERACDLAPTEQHDLLARECAADPELHQRLLTLLARDREPRTKLDRPALQRLTPVSIGLPERLGPYRILGLLGRGG